MNTEKSITKEKRDKQYKCGVDTKQKIESEDIQYSIEEKNPIAPTYKGNNPYGSVYVPKPGDVLGDEEEAKQILGGKGAGLARMIILGFPVPLVATISTEVGREYMKTGVLTDRVKMEIVQAVRDLEDMSGKTFFDSPLGLQNRSLLLVSVRSGAPVSMPGMMETILNLGMNDERLDVMAKDVGRAVALDIYRRFIQGFGNVVHGIDDKEFEAVLTNIRQKYCVKTEQQFSEAAWCEVVDTFKKIVRCHGKIIPQDPLEQLFAAVGCVFESWNSEKARAYRKYEAGGRIPDDLCTAVNIQAMVYGNLDDNSCSGVLFTRNRTDGKKELDGDFLIRAQGEEVVAGIRDPLPIQELQNQKGMARLYEELSGYGTALETHYKDMQDAEFTIERGKLWMLQTRDGKRAGPAAFKIACDLVDEGLKNREEALLTITKDHVRNMLLPQIDPEEKKCHKPIAVGVNASPGAGRGMVTFASSEAERMGKVGQEAILTTEFTDTGDVAGMLKSQGVLSKRGGKTSHAALVSGGAGIPAVPGCSDIEIDLEKQQFTARDGIIVKAGDWITIDGGTGEVFLGKLKLIPPTPTPEYKRVMEWAKEIKKLEVWANADTPEDAMKAREHGATGIGLCRTEHMFFKPERQPVVQAMIMALDNVERQTSLDALLDMQRADFEKIFRAMDGLPCTIRLIDPPLHEFLPSLNALTAEVATLRERERLGQMNSGDSELLAEKEKILKVVKNLHEDNPMLGKRGIRLGIIQKEITEMQVTAIIEAAINARKGGVAAVPKIMVPLVATESEMEHAADIIRRTAQNVIDREGIQISYEIGTMTEVPRAALMAGKIARHSSFTSFGTNDLTATTYGLGRDESEKGIIPFYKEKKIMQVSPFETVDADGVGELIRMTIKRAIMGNPDIKISICGEQAADPESIEFIDLLRRDPSLRFNSISCSPMKVPVAILAAAQAVIKATMK